MSDLAFCLAHPAMLRRIMFSVAELEGWSDFVYNYGYPAEASDKGDISLQLLLILSQAKFVISSALSH